MGLSAVDSQRLQHFFTSIKTRSEQFLGYPVSRDFDYRDLLQFFAFPLNNLGDPFQKCTWKVDSRQYEQEVVSFIAGLFRADAGDFWGYVTNGGSEGNLYGLYLARELYPQGIVYFSADTHYSVRKNLHLLKMTNIRVNSQDSGEIEYENLREHLLANNDRPAIIFANIGTTMTEAKDNIRTITTILKETGITHHYIHSDAALCGGIAPFITPRIPFDFADGADSISVSGHKSFGSPIPCGVVIVRKNNVGRIARSIEYIGSLDSTISGSRNGLTPLILWYAIRSLGLKGLQKRVDQSLSMAEYVLEKLRDIGIPAWRNPHAITIVFPEVSSYLIEKYQLATAEGRTHLVAMPHISKSLVDCFLLEVKREYRSATYRRGSLGH